MTARFPANENFPASIVDWLRERGDDVVHAADSLPGACDTRVIEAAIAESRILLTFGRDFGEIVFRGRIAGVRGVVRFQFRRFDREFVHERLRTILAAPPLLNGYFTVVTPAHVRQTPLAAQDHD